MGLSYTFMVFLIIHPQRLGYCEDINFEASKFREVILTSFSLIFSLERLDQSVSLHLTLMGRQRLCATIVLSLVAESNCVASTQMVVPYVATKPIVAKFQKGKNGKDHAPYPN